MSPKALIHTAVLASVFLAQAVAAQTVDPKDPNFFEPVTKVENGALQLVFGERAIITVAEDGTPILGSVEKGSLAIAHPPGKVKETFGEPPEGTIAIALDGSAEKRTTYLKIWNAMNHPVIYRAGVLALSKGKLTPATVRVCAAPGGQIRYESWPRPVVAVALGNFQKAANDSVCN